MFETGKLQQSILVERSTKDGIKGWFLTPGNYRAYGLPLSLLGVSIEIPSQQSENSTVDMPYIANVVASS